MVSGITYTSKLMTVVSVRYPRPTGDGTRYLNYARGSPSESFGGQLVMVEKLPSETERIWVRMNVSVLRITSRGG